MDNKNILKIRFSKSPSFYYQDAIEKLKEFPRYKLLGDGELYNSLSLHYKEINEYWLSLEELFLIIGGWKSTRLTIFNEVTDFYSLHKYLVPINCHENYLKANSKSYCYIHENQSSGWNCCLIKDWDRWAGVTLIYDPEDYRKSIYGKWYKPYWFTFGEFVDDLVWEIDKSRIKSIMRDCIKNNKLFLCSVFDQNICMSIVDNLPSEIDINNDPDWEVVYKNILIMDKWIAEPVGIRPVHEIPEVPVVGISIKVNPYMLLSEKLNDKNKKVSLNQMLLSLGLKKSKRKEE